MKLPTLTQLAKGVAYFKWYSDGILRYDVSWEEILTEPDYRGPEHGDAIIGSKLHVFSIDIPIADAGGGFFTEEMKGLNVLRWARKQLDVVKQAQEQQ